ncbi:efflux transporter outer membrane subunit [Achromobacter aegrifaciens]
MSPRLLVNVLLVSALSGLGGCAVGPDFQAPQPQLPAQWRAPEASAASSVPVPQGVNTSWWDSFGDPALSALIAEATDANLDIRIAHERLLQSRAALRVTEADGLPAIGAGASYKRGQNSEAGLSDPSGRNGRSSFNLWQASVDASWELDLWGRVRREVEQAGAQSQAALEAQRGVVLAIRAETARNYILLRGAQNQLDVLRKTLANAERNLALTRLRQREGVATELDVSQADAQAAAIEAAVPPLALRIDQLMNALALLLEQPPGALRERLAAIGPIPGGPVQVPVGLPSELAERRPDIRRAQAHLHAAVAAIGVAEGDFYPRITLSGNLGLQALQLHDLDTDNASIFGVGPVVQIPIFQGGRLRGRLRLRESQAQEAALVFQKTVLNAWHEVDNAMTSYQAQQLTRSSLERASESARRALLNAQRQYSAGASDFVNVLSAQNAVLASDQARVSTQAAVSLALVDLYRSLGGGWEQAAAAGPSPASAPPR